MNKSKKLSGIYLFILFLATAVPTVLRTVALLQNYDYASGYFLGGKALITAAGVIASALVLLLLTFAFTAEMPAKLRASFNTPATYIPVGAVGAALVFFAADAYLALKAFEAPILVLIKMKNVPAILALGLTVLSVCACVFFVANALITDKSSSTRAFFGICTVLFLLFYFALIYADKKLPVNAPNKIVDQLAYLSASAFFLFETRISLDREYWRSYVAFGFAASALTAYSAIPSVIIYFANGEIISKSIFETALTLTLFIFILSRTVLALNLPEECENEFVSLIKRFGDERNTSLEEKHAIEKRAYLEIINRFNEVEETPVDPSESETPTENDPEESDGGPREQISIFDGEPDGSDTQKAEATPSDEQEESTPAEQTETPTVSDEEDEHKEDALPDVTPTKESDKANTEEEVGEAKAAEEQVSIFDNAEEGKSE